MTFPISPPPGDWNFPPGHTVTAEEMYERVDRPLGYIYDQIQGNRGCGAVFSGSTSVAASTEATLRVSNVQSFGDESAVWSAGAGGAGLVLPGMGLYLIELNVTIDAPWAGRCFCDIEAFGNATQRQACVVNGSDSQVLNSGALLLDVDNLANNNFTMLPQLYHQTGAPRTATLQGRAFRIYRGSLV